MTSTFTKALRALKSRYVNSSMRQENASQISGCSNSRMTQGVEWLSDGHNGHDRGRVIVPNATGIRPSVEGRNSKKRSRLCNVVLFFSQWKTPDVLSLKLGFSPL